MVTDQPGAWFDEVLDGLAEQDYENLRVLVVETGSHSVASRVLDKIPDAVVHQAPDATGFGDAANRVQTLVKGSTFYLFLRDDVALAPSAVTLLVAEALESNAAILGPKILDWDDPSRILAMGGTVDAFGVLTPYVESGELDQQQHDRVRDAFAVTGAAMLVRADLFETIGGFDPRIKSTGEDLDFCWRAQVAGGRVLVVPGATVREGGRTPGADSERSGRLALRHRHHVIAKCYGWIYLIPVMVGAIFLSLLELIYSLLVARFSQARDVAWAWAWNLYQIPYVLSSRRRIARTRKTRDREIRRRQSSGSTRLKLFLQGRIGGEVALQTLRGRAGRRIADNFLAGPRRSALLASGILLAVLGFGSRHLLTRGVPAYGQFADFPDAASLLSEYWSGWREIGLGVSGIGPAALGLLGAAGQLTFGAMGALRLVLIMALLPIGLIGMWRLSSPIDSHWGRVVAVVLYAALPVPYNALVDGRWDTLLLVAATPFVVLRVVRAFGVSPYNASSRGLLHQSVALGFLLGVVAAFEPLVLLLAAIVCLVVAITGCRTVGLIGVGRGLVVVVVALSISSLMHFPWVAVLGDSDAVLHHVFARSPTPVPAELASLLRFAPGSYGNAWVAWAPLFVAVVPLLLARAARLRIAVIAGVSATAGFGLAWMSGNGWLRDLMDREVLIGDSSLVLAAVGVCWCAATGPSAVRIDGELSPAFLRRIVAGAGAVSLALSSGVLLLESADGRWGTPTNDLKIALSLLDDRDIGPSYRVLWLGSADVLPLEGWPIADEGLHFGTSVRGHPDIRHRWAGSSTSTHGQLNDAVKLGLSGDTVRMGRLLAPFGVKYLAVVERSTPSFSEGIERLVSPRVREALNSQLDLRPLAADPSVMILFNESWMSSRAQFAEPVRLAGLDEPGELVVTDLTSGIAVLTERKSSREQHGFVGVGEVLVADAFDPRWRLLVGEEIVEPEMSFGWAMRFSSPVAGPAALWHIRPNSVADRVVVQIALWAVIARITISERRKTRQIGSPT